MKTYHITYLETPESHVSTGKNYRKHSIYEAISDFEYEYPNGVILYVASEEMFNYKY